ncbi:hypothetical protein FF38_03876 [Lucilia cuprina]|uniref:Uncharacterized protein n=1 Tax=Lucilia cuprina TaxID=7375 RepID=A0A0L0CGP2_LUCCU|nr:hypothetical protein FF38_03876 [Lucilia cuprina]
MKVHDIFNPNYDGANLRSDRIYRCCNLFSRITENDVVVDVIVLALLVLEGGSNFCVNDATVVDGFPEIVDLAAAVVVGAVGAFVGFFALMLLLNEGFADNGLGFCMVALGLLATPFAGTLAAPAPLNLCIAALADADDDDELAAAVFVAVDEYIESPPLRFSISLTISPNSPISVLLATLLR